MSLNPSQRSATTHSIVIPLLPIIAVVFIAFLVIGLALPVLPLHVRQGLGLGAFVVGLVSGAQFAASLLSRFWAGHFADTRGAKHATVTGLLVATTAGLFYLLSLVFVRQPLVSVTILLIGRAVRRRSGERYRHGRVQIWTGAGRALRCGDRSAAPKRTIARNGHRDCITIDLPFQLSSGKCVSHAPINL
jgi:MFS family permease